MGGCRCSYKSCRSATKTTENLHFFHYPVKHRERCAIWIRNADKPEFANLPDYQLRNKVICGLHFEDKYFANLEKRRLVHNAIPSLDAGCDSTSDDLSYIKEVEILPTSNDGSTFTLSLDDLQPGNSAKKQKLDYNSAHSINLPDVAKVEPDVYTIDPSYFNQSFYNNDNIKEVVINSASALSDNLKQEEVIDDEDCMIYDTHNSSLSGKKENLSFANENKLQTLFFDHDELDTPQHVQIQDSKGNIMVTDIGNTNPGTSITTNTPGKVCMLKSANGTTTTIKKIKLASNQTLTPITIQQPNASGQIVKRTVFKRVIPASSVQQTATTTAVASTPTTSQPVVTPASTSTAVAQPTAGKFKLATQMATNTIRLTNKNLLRCLKGRLPDSILGAVSLHLNKRRNAVTVEEQEYETMITAVPLAGRASLRNFGWCIPTIHTQNNYA
ncbi:uncharacterized protein [Atheta coriaria]|uniref:uncharacterized protein n=1 Tax=Dalotia coriaria TaxID=877792 RepID=UPI0031F3977E